MKKMLLVIALVLVAVPAWGQVWTTANEATVSWDAVTKLADGSSIPAVDKVSYNVSIKNKKTGAVIAVANTQSTQQTIVFNLEGRYFVGVSAVRAVVGEDGVTVEETMESEVSWSENPAVCYNGQAFGIRYFVHPGSPQNLRK